ncbi:uncharacterized protein LOC132713436 [Ruditapes philippinarum]|uniref:uncharacterized protein LOC132713436 n=1 Tax=Ruditapes philippinarum TaxID=129788 RepID=UPI00295BE78B|nr:uncharacterized protein LOC132713436 [Ruditapes philippinarum]
MEDRDNKLKVTTEDKLYSLHNEIKALTDTCHTKNISYFQIKKSAKLFLRFERRKKSSRSSVALTLIAICVSIVAVLFNVESSKRLINSYGRHAFIKVLPLFDWTSLHGMNCIIPNVFNSDDDRLLLKEDCQNCSSITQIDVGVTIEEIANNYLYKDVPVIIQNTQQSAGRVGIHDIVKLYLENDVMRLYTSCNLESNIHLKRKDHRRFLDGIRNKEISQFYIHWENCFKEAAKLFRSLYERPELLPSSVELTPSSWVFICSNFTERKDIRLPYKEQVIVLIQLSGSLDITLNPRKPCTDVCQSIHARIPEGGTLILTDFYYDVEYITCNHGNSITVGLGGKLDI